ncbi:hypothetical protein GGS26DRAFT_584729 [Hypomontagnella submonticulosa]|nr:hypothetical protein GGS26DRAFT_584729 [Hypomontagnella submonticulosa]
MAPKSAPSVAYFEEADDDGKTIPGIEPKYARSTAQSSPSKEKPNTSRSRKDSNRRESRSPISLSDSDTTEPPLTARRNRDREAKMKEKKRASLVKQQQPPPQRPPHRSSKTMPVPSSRISDESSYYGVHSQNTVAAASSARPRARTRPESYYGQHPPISGSAYAHQPPPPSHLPPPSFPPPQWMGPPGPPMGHALVHQPIPSPTYADLHPPPRDLASRFQRPQSAMGFQPAPKPIDYDPPKEKAVARRTSVNRKISKEHDDSRRMPPPPRPASTQPNRLVFRPPPPSHSITRRDSIGKSVGFENHDLVGDGTMYKAVARREVEYGSGALPARPRPQSYDTDSILDGGYDLEPASRGRRSSFYNFEDKVRDASRYQEDVSGGPAPPLTAEALKRVKNGGSSRSTRSSASRDESDYKQSATTRTTRSSSGDDDITIKLPMGAVIEVGNTKIHCKDGGDINIGRTGASRGGSDHAASSNYSDDRKSRGDRLATRTRAASQAGSYSRTRLSAPPLHAPPAYHYDDDYYEPHHGPRYAHAPYIGYRDEDEYSEFSQF